MIALLYLHSASAMRYKSVRRKAAHVGAYGQSLFLAELLINP